jgi:hypothetical protein
MTPAQAAWLRKLRDEGPQVIGPPSNKRTTGFCTVNGLTDFERRKESGGWYSYAVTPAGLAALAAYEERVK